MEFNEYVIRLYLGDDGLMKYLIKNFCDIDASSLSHNDLEEIRGNMRGRLGNLKNLLDKLPSYLLENRGSTIFRNVMTINGYQVDLCKSALQKYIRRGEVDKACRVFTELESLRISVNYSQTDTTNYLNRLRVICLEEIGFVSSNLLFDLNKSIKTVKSLVQKKIVYSKKISRELLMWVKNACLSLHTRTYSHVKNMSYHFDGKLDFDHNLYDYKGERPDVILPFIHCVATKNYNFYYYMKKLMLNKSGKETGKYVTTGHPYYRCKTADYLLMHVLRTRFIKTDYQLKVFNVCLEWLKDLNVKERTLCITHVIFVIFYDKEFAYDSSEKGEEKGDENKTKSIDKYYDEMILAKHNNISIVFDDYVYDMHTKIGRRYKDALDFAYEGSLVSYELNFDPVLYNQYISDRTRNMVPRTETDEFTLKSRIQLVTSEGKTDTYFATDIYKADVFVKGPYKTFAEVKNIFDLHNIIGLFEGINIAKSVNIKCLRCNMFKDIHLGIRKKIGANDKAFFIITKDIIGMKQYPTKIKTTKSGMNIQVVDFDKIYNKNINIPTKDMSDIQMFSFLLQLTIRHCFRLGDFAARNFLVYYENVYLLDIEKYNLIKDSSIKINKELMNKVKESYEKNKKMYNKILTKWKSNKFTETVLHYFDKNLKEVVYDTINKILKDGLYFV